MPTPSIVNATAVGKEVIRRSYIDGQAETEGTILTGVANHIMTIVSIVVVEMGGLTDSKFNMYVDYDLGGTDLYLLVNQAVGDNETFIWNDRFAITATDKLHIIGVSAGGTAAYDVWCTYIDQQFAAP
jgi:hypothetical protein